MASRTMLQKAKRTYVVRLVSDPTRFVSRLAFQYPDDDRAKWATFEARQDESKRNAEAIAEERREKDLKDGVVPNRCVKARSNDKRNRTMMQKTSIRGSARNRQTET